MFMLISSPTAKDKWQPCHFKQDPCQISLVEPAHPEHEELGGIFLQKTSVLVTGWVPHGKDTTCPWGGNGPALLAPGGLCVPKEDGEWKTGEQAAWGRTTL